MSLSQSSIASSSFRSSSMLLSQPRRRGFGFFPRGRTAKLKQLFPAGFTVDGGVDRERRPNAALRSWRAKKLEELWQGLEKGSQNYFGKHQGGAANVYGWKREYRSRDGKVEENESILDSDGHWRNIQAAAPPPTSLSTDRSNHVNQEGEIDLISLRRIPRKPASIPQTLAKTSDPKDISPEKLHQQELRNTTATGSPNPRQRAAVASKEDTIGLERGFWNPPDPNSHDFTEENPMPPSALQSTPESNGISMKQVGSITFNTTNKTTAVNADARPDPEHNTSTQDNEIVQKKLQLLQQNKVIKAEIEDLSMKAKDLLSKIEAELDPSRSSTTADMKEKSNFPLSSPPPSSPQKSSPAGELRYHPLKNAVNQSSADISDADIDLLLPSDVRSAVGKGSQGLKVEEKRTQRQNNTSHGEASAKNGPDVILSQSKQNIEESNNFHEAFDPDGIAAQTFPIRRPDSGKTVDFEVEEAIKEHMAGIGRSNFLLAAKIRTDGVKEFGEVPDPEITTYAAPPRPRLAETGAEHGEGEHMARAKVADKRKVSVEHEQKRPLQLEEDAENLHESFRREISTSPPTSVKSSSLFTSRDHQLLHDLETLATHVEKIWGASASSEIWTAIVSRMTRTGNNNTETLPNTALQQKQKILSLARSYLSELEEADVSLSAHDRSWPAPNMELMKQSNRDYMKTMRVALENDDVETVVLLNPIGAKLLALTNAGEFELVMHGRDIKGVEERGVAIGEFEGDMERIRNQQYFVGTMEEKPAQARVSSLHYEKQISTSSSSPDISVHETSKAPPTTASTTTIATPSTPSSSSSSELLILALNPLTSQITLATLTTPPTKPQEQEQVQKTPTHEILQKLNSPSAFLPFFPLLENEGFRLIAGEKDCLIWKSQYPDPSRSPKTFLNRWNNGELNPTNPNPVDGTTITTTTQQQRQRQRSSPNPIDGTVSYIPAVAYMPEFAATLPQQQQQHQQNQHGQQIQDKNKTAGTLRRVFWAGVWVGACSGVVSIGVEAFL